MSGSPPPAAPAESPDAREGGRLDRRTLLVGGGLTLVALAGAGIMADRAGIIDLPLIGRGPDAGLLAVVADSEAALIVQYQAALDQDAASAPVRNRMITFVEHHRSHLAALGFDPDRAVGRQPRPGQTRTPTPLPSGTGQPSVPTEPRPEPVATPPAAAGSLPGYFAGLERQAFRMRREAAQWAVDADHARVLSLVCASERSHQRAWEGR